MEPGALRGVNAEGWIAKSICPETEELNEGTSRSSSLDGLSATDVFAFCQLLGGTVVRSSLAVETDRRLSDRADLPASAAVVLSCVHLWNVSMQHDTPS